MKTGHTLVLAAGTLGVLTVMTQTVLLREFLAVAEGNELVLGIVLACWMALTGAGAFLARRSHAPALLDRTILILSILPLCSAVCLRVARHEFFAPGTMLELWETLALAVALLAPFCLLSGHAFVRIAESFSRAGRPIASAYGWEAVGSVVGGTAGFALTGRMAGDIPVLCGLLAAGSAVSVLLSPSSPRRRISTLFAATLALGAVFFSGTIDRSSRALLFPGQQVVLSSDTPYGSLVVTEHEGQRTLYENGILLSSTGDVVSREEGTHFAMIQRSAPRRVLVVSGAASGTLEEVLKYPVSNLDYVELNPGISAAAPFVRQPPGDPRVTTIGGDVRAFLRSTTSLYDVLLINTPDPTTAQTNRLFTSEFLALARSRMSDSSVLSISLLPSVEYYGDRARMVASSVFWTLHKIFPEVAVIPGERNYFLASRASLSIAIARLVETRGIITTAVNAYYIDDALLRERSRRFVGSLDTVARLNSDLHPIAYLRQIAHWLESVGASIELIGWIAAGLVIAGLTLMPRFGSGIYAAGFAAAGIEVITLLGYQCLYGFVYHSLWLVTGGFMVGLAAGAALSARSGRHVAKRWYLGGLLALACSSVCSALLLEVLVSLGRAETDGVVAMMFLILCAGGATGLVFGAGSMLAAGEPGRIAGGLYAADLAGSALGSLLTAAFLVPMLGTAVAAGSIATLPLAAILLHRIRRST